jgi:carboxymethylenebutenolidase
MDSSKGAIILIHEVWGLNDQIRGVAKRLEEEGYTVLAPDLLKDTGIEGKLTQDIMADLKDPERRSEAQKKMRALTAPIHSPEFGQKTVEKLKEMVTLLKEKNNKVAVVGFCFGGTYSYTLAVNDPRISAAVPFYGHAPEPLSDVEKINCPVLAFYGEQDTALIDSLPDLEAEMKKYGKDFEYIVYPDTGHAFFNETNPVTYNKEAAEDAWKKLLEFLAGKMV